MAAYLPTYLLPRLPPPPPASRSRRRRGRTPSAPSSLSASVPWHTLHQSCAFQVKKSPGPATSHIAYTKESCFRVHRLAIHCLRVLCQLKNRIPADNGRNLLPSSAMNCECRPPVCTEMETRRTSPSVDELPLSQFHQSHLVSLSTKPHSSLDRHDARREPNDRPPCRAPHRRRARRRDRRPRPPGARRLRPRRRRRGRAAPRRGRVSSAVRRRGPRRGRYPAVVSRGL